MNCLSWLLLPAFLSNCRVALLVPTWLLAGDCVASDYPGTLESVVRSDARPPPRFPMSCVTALSSVFFSEPGLRISEDAAHLPADVPRKSSIAACIHSNSGHVIADAEAQVAGEHVIGRDADVVHQALHIADLEL